MEQRRRKHIRLRDYDYSQNGAYYVTICTKNREKLLAHVFVGRAALSPPEEHSVSVELTEIGKVCQRYLERIPLVYRDIHLDTYVIMPNHIHAVLVFDAADGGLGAGRPTVSSVVRSLKSMVTREIGVPIWQESFYEHIIRNETDLSEIRRYIDENPLKWELDKLHCDP